ncbi:class I SAM-dependent methyltransferase [Yersinia sp. 2541 StPb PI]|uniref:class I SAM-dependent methyltransferase n=1 Tax=Yersinia sp. 2541 StPb PI TaxID=3117407 RepID=UPI003FA420CC
MNKSLLIFPSNMPESRTFSLTAERLGLHVINATSEQDENISKGSHQLPYITNLSFKDHFVSLLVKESIGYVFTPHPVIWHYLHKLKEELAPQYKFEICNDAPLEASYRRFERAFIWAEACLKSHICDLPEKSAPLPQNYYANLYLNYLDIPGQSDEHKLMVLAEIARSAVPGDIVEIGTFFGRSAYALAWLAQKHQLGNIICVDPWHDKSAQDQGVSATLVNESADQARWHEIFSGFIASVSGLSNINYLRQPSAIACATYQACARQKEIVSPELGSVSISGKISILHIDGNHKFEEVQQDINLWLPLMNDGGWVLIDDYNWAFGDGPKLAGDRLKKHHRVKYHFVSGDTLYLKL